MIGKNAILIRNIYSSDYPQNNEKYFGSFYGKVFKILFDFQDNTYLTDMFIPEFMNEENDYVYHGFIKVMNKDFRILNEWE